MNPLPKIPELLEVAERVVWFKKPMQALNDPVLFISHAMKYGTADDVVTLEKAGIGLDQYREVLEHAPPGLFDPRSWTYWNLKCGRSPVPPLPMRNLG